MEKRYENDRVMFPELGFAIPFQTGSFKRNGVNGLTVEDMLEIVIMRLEFFQKGPFACDENDVARERSTEALLWLRKRSQRVRSSHAPEVAK